MAETLLSPAELSAQISLVDRMATDLRDQRAADVRRRAEAGESHASIARQYGFTGMWVRRLIDGTHRGRDKRLYNAGATEWRQGLELRPQPGQIELPGFAETRVEVSDAV